MTQRAEDIKTSKIQASNKMEKLLFSFHDLVLVMTAFMALLFAVFFLTLKQGKANSNRLLAGFLLTQAFMPIILITLYGTAFQSLEGVHAKYLYTLSCLFIWLEGILLYAYTKSLLFKNFRLEKKHYWHLAPIVPASLFLYIIFYRFDYETQMAIGYFGGTVCTQMIGLSILIQISGIAYAYSCLQNIKQYKHQLEEKYANTDKVDLFWINLLVKGHLFIRVSWIPLPILIFIMRISSYEPIYFLQLAHSYGGLLNYIWLLLISGILYFGLNYSPLFEGIKKKSPFNKQTVKPGDIEKIRAYMQEHKPYLSADITLTELAAMIKMPEKNLSTVLNIHFKKNFCEFINQYRITDAANMLQASEHENKTILEILYGVGFNSKSAFNRFFKEQLGVTPSQYRRAILKI